MTEKMLSVKFVKGENTLPQQYRVVTLEKEDEDNEDEDNEDENNEDENNEDEDNEDEDNEDENKDYSGSSQICINGMVMISTLFARLHL